MFYVFTDRSRISSLFFVQVKMICHTCKPRVACVTSRSTGGCILKRKAHTPPIRCSAVSVHNREVRGYVQH